MEMGGMLEKEWEVRFAVDEVEQVCKQEMN